jgi:ferritin-like metal-binding protein YciE
MRQVTTNEILALNKFLQMETNSLAMAKAGINVISDQQLKTLAQSGITATEGRIRGLQQFIAENNIASSANQYTTAINTNTTASDTNNNLPKEVM